MDYFGIYESLQVHANANILTPNIFGKRIEAHMTSHVLTRGVISPKTYLRFFDTQNPLGPRRSNKRMTAALMRAALGLGIFLDQSAPMTWSTISRDDSSSRLGLNIEEIDDVANLYPEQFAKDGCSGWLGL